MKKKLKHLFILVGSFLFMHSKAQVYSGYIDKYPILLELDTAYGHVNWSTYFYQSKLKNIVLEGEINENQVILYQKYMDIEDSTELFALTYSDNTLNGTWTNNGKTLKVELSETDINLEEFKTEKLSYERDSISKYGDKELVWIKEKYSQEKLFRLGNGFTEVQRNYLNPKLDTMHQNFALDNLYCEYFETFIDVTLVDNGFISFMLNYNNFCYGAHPNYGVAGYNYDVEKLKEIEQVKYLYPKINVFELLKNKYKNSLKEDDSDCEYFLEENKEVWQYASWYLTDFGVVFIPNFPHALTPCETEFILSYKELETYK